MTKRNLFSGLLFLLVLSFTYSCSNEHEFDREEIKQGNVLTDEEQGLARRVFNSTNKIDMDDAKEEAMSIIGNRTRSGNSSIISNAFILKAENNVRTRTGDVENSSIFPDTIAYVFNFSGNNGFAIVAADKRIEDRILAFSHSGNMPNEIDNPALYAMFSLIEDYTLSQIEEIELHKDSIKSNLSKKMISESPSMRRYCPEPKDWFLEEPTYEQCRIPLEWKVKSNVSPLTDWGWAQEYPFNEKVRYINSEEGDSPSGCVPAAVGQLLCYYEDPQFKYDWKNIKKYKNEYHSTYTPQIVKDQLADLMAELGKNMKADYDPEGTGVSHNDRDAYLSRIGYKKRGLSFDNGQIKGHIQNKQIVYASGYAKKVKKEILGIGVSTSYKEGHAWLIDGFYRRERDVIIYTDVIRQVCHDRFEIASSSESYSRDSEEYYHFNWGWGSFKNGYLSAGCFNANSIIKDLPNTRSYQKDNYQYKVELLAFEK